MSITSDLMEERSITQIIYDANKSSSLILSGTEISIQNQSADIIKLSTLGITYNNMSTSWTNITNNSNVNFSTNFLKSIIQPTNSSTLNVNNTVQIQNSNSSPTHALSLTSNASGNRIAIDGDYGLPNQILTSGGTNEGIHWGSGGGAQAGTLADVLTNSNVANMNIDMNEHSISNISSIFISICIFTPFI